MRADPDSTTDDDQFTDRIRSILSDINEPDYERVEPPAGLLEQIKLSIAADPDRPPKQAPFSGSPASTVVEYRIDANDIVTNVGQSWANFARSNDAPELAVPASDRTLWTYFEDDEIRDLWRLLVQRVRSVRKVAEVPLRCDAPHARRWFDMTVAPEADGSVHFRCAQTFEELRPSVSLLDPQSERDDSLQTVPLCSWCGQGQHGSVWLDIEELVHTARLLERASMPPLSYGICASCRDEMAAELLVPVAADDSMA